MVDLETVLTYLTLISVPVGIFYYIMTLNNTRKNQQQQLETRQAHLFMTLYETARSREFRRQYYALTMQQTWNSYEEYLEKYGPTSNMDVFSDHGALIEYFDGIGVLLKKDLVDLEMVKELLFTMIVKTWEKLGPVIIEARKIDVARSELYKNFEYLYNEVTK